MAGTRSAESSSAVEPPITALLAAADAGRIDAVRALLDAHPGLLSERGSLPGHTGVRTALHFASTAPTKTSSRMLLDAGADPNAHYPGGNPTIRYTILTCAVGRGEEGAQPHPRARELAALLMERGAYPYDMQVLYNVFANHASRVHLTEDIVWLLELMHEHSVRVGRGADWDDPEWNMLDVGGYGPGAYYLLGAATDAGLPRLAEWMLQHGASPNTRALRPRGADRSLYESACDAAAPRCGAVPALRRNADGGRAR